MFPRGSACKLSFVCYRLFWTIYKLTTFFSLRLSVNTSELKIKSRYR